MTTRDQILKAASKSFFTKGYTNTTYRDIAKECNISVGNVTYHFRRKEDMLLGFYTKSVEVLNDVFSKHEELHFTGIINYITIHYAFLYWMKSSPLMFRLYTDTLKIDTIRDEYNRINNQLLLDNIGIELNNMDKRDIFLISSITSGGEQELMYLYSTRSNEIDFDYLISFSFRTLFLHLGMDNELITDHIKKGFENGRKLYAYSSEYIEDFLG